VVCGGKRRQGNTFNYLKPYNLKNFHRGKINWHASCYIKGKEKNVRTPDKQNTPSTTTEEHHETESITFESQ
jgi:hypothetical protein